VWRLKTNRRVNDQPFQAFRGHPYEAAHDWLTGAVKALGVSHSATYCVMKRLTRPTTEVRRLYRGRAQSEAVIRVGNDPLGLTGGQACSARAQVHHITCCLVAFYVLKRERREGGLSIYKLKHQL
jgi:hypothetical protein